MSVMTKKRKTKPLPPPRVERARDRGEAILVSVELSPDMDRVLERYCREQGPSKKFVVSKALEKFFEDKGLWPPPETK